MSVTIEAVDGELITTGETDQLWRIVLVHGEHRRYLKDIDNYDKVWTSEKSFAVMSFRDMAYTLQATLELYPEWHEKYVADYGPWTQLVLQEFPFTAECAEHTWTIKDDRLEFPNWRS